MEFRERTDLWNDYYHREALRDSDVGLVRALYEQRIKDLEKHIEELEQERVNVEVEEETLYLNFDGSTLKDAVEEMLKLL